MLKKQPVVVAPNGRRCGYVRVRRITCAIFMCGSTSFGSLPTYSAELDCDIRAHNHEGIQKLIALDVLEASRIVKGNAQLVVGSRFADISPQSKSHLAVMVLRYLHGRCVDVSSLVLIDGRTGSMIARYRLGYGFAPM